MLVSVDSVPNAKSCPARRVSSPTRRMTTVAAVLGHASLQSTAIYTTAIGTEARELVARLWQ